MARHSRSGAPELPDLLRIFSDRPLAADEGLAFDFGALARTLAELAWNPDNATPFTAVVRGGWGRGKTTLLCQTRRLLDGSPKPKGCRQVRTLWLNAWKYPDDDTVLAGLLGALLDAYRQGHPLDQLAFHVGNHKQRLARLVLHAAAPWAFAAPNDEGAWTGPYDRLEERRAFHDLFRQLFVQASHQLFHPGAVLRDLGSRPADALWNAEEQRRYALAIFLDDLDRCRPERVLEVLEAINLFLDLPGVCFYLGLDVERVEDLLPTYLGAHKARFLEKIVQISLDLPEVSEAGVGAFVGELLAESRLWALLRRDAVSEDDDDWNDIAVLAAVLRSRHPRHIKRFLNDLALSLAVLRNTGSLGEADDKLPERAVVAWHLLREALKPPKWREIGARTANLGGFLRRWAAFKEQTADGAENDLAEEPKHLEDWEDHLQQLDRASRLDRHIAILSSLNKTQLDLLVHTGSPPRELGGELEERSHHIVWIPIPAGRFARGSDQGRDNERPIRDVTIAAFDIAQNPVTNAQYSAFVQARGINPPPHWQDGRVPEGKAQHPVVHVSWHDAQAFCRWASDALGDEGYRIRLLTEAEWEYVARGNQCREYPWGFEEPDPTRCNFGRHVGDTTPVGSYPKGATPEGVNDLSGNIWEWVEDAWHGSYDGTLGNGSARAGDSGADRVIRGGSWGGQALYCRSAFRESRPPDYRFGTLGFRCARIRV